MKRLLCVWFPNFPLQRFLSEQPEHRARPCALFQQDGRQGIRVVACSREAVAEGIVPGMSLSDARSLLPSAHFSKHQPDADATALLNLAWSCQQFSPYVGIERFAGLACLMMDVTGVAHLFGGDRSLARQVVTFLSKRGYFTHISIAPSVGTAWAIACYGHWADSSRSLWSLPVEALRLPDEVLDRLHAFDLSRVGQILKLPRHELPSRFGAVLIERIDQLLGERDEKIVPERPPKPVQAVWSSDDGIFGQHAIRCVCSELLHDILSTLQARREGILRLRLEFQGDGASTLYFDQGMAQPSTSMSHLLELLTLRLESEHKHIPDGLHTIRVTAVETSPLEHREQTLFGEDQRPIEGAYHRLLDRLTTRLGTQAVLRPELHPEPLPEDSVAYRPATDRYAPTKRPTEMIDDDPLPTSSRPLCLMSPTPVAVMSVIPEGPPVRFRWQHRDYMIARCTEPERIDTGWWTPDGNLVRTYYRAETTTGERFWLFRDPRGHWFLHGVFD